MIVDCEHVQARLVSPREAHQLHALASDPAVSRHLQWPAHESLDDSLSFIADTHALWRQRRAWLPGIFDRDRQRLLGCIGISSVDEHNRRAEVGTWLGVPHQGAGHNLPAKSAACHAAFEELGLERVELLVRTANERSIRSLRALPAVREEGVLARRLSPSPATLADDPDAPLDDAVLFAVLADEWREAVASGAWPAATTVAASHA